MQGYNSQSNNIYGYPPQYGGNFYVQPSSNIYAQPGWNNPGYGAQLSGNAYVPSVQNNPINVQKVQSKVTTSTAPSTMEPLVPLVPTSNEANIEKNSCFKSFWEKFDTIEELTGYQKCGVIFTCVVHCIIDFNEIAYTSSTKSINLGLFLSMDLLYIAFAIFTCVSTIKVRMLRLIDSVLAIIFAILSIIMGIIQLLHLGKLSMQETEDEREAERIKDDKTFPFLNAIACNIIMNIFFYVNWKIKICCRCNLDNVSSTRENNNYNDNANNENNDTNKEEYIPPQTSSTSSISINHHSPPPRPPHHHPHHGPHPYIGGSISVHINI